MKRPSTIRGTSSALKLFERFEDDTSRDLGAEIKIAWEREDGDLLEEVVVDSILNLGTWLKTNRVQARGKEKSLVATTVGQYFGQIKTKIQEQTSTLKCWEEHDKGGWYTQILDAVKNAYESNILEGDDETRGPTCRAIHLKADSGGMFMQFERQWKDMQGSDIDSIIELLLKTEFKNPLCHEERMKLLLLFYTVQRGGTSKYLSHQHNVQDFYS